MTPAWAQRQEELLSDCVVSPDVFNHMADRLGDFVVPYQQALETEAESVPPSVPRAAPLASPLTVLPSPILRRLSSPRVAALGRPSPWPGAPAGRVRRRVVLGVCCRGGSTKMPLVFPIRATWVRAVC